MFTQYRVDVYTIHDTTPHFRLVDVLDPSVFKWAFRFRQALNSTGSFTGTLPDSYADTLALHRLLVVRMYFEGSWVVLNTYVLLGQTFTDNSQMLVKGPDMGYLLESALIAPTTTGTSGYTIKEDHVDDLMKDFVLENIGVSAAATRQFKQLLVSGKVGALPNFKYEASQTEYLLDALRNIADATICDFWFDFNDINIIFNAGVRGTDRTVSSGLPYLVFSEANQNMANARLELNYRGKQAQYKDLYIWGQGSAEEQELYTYSTSSTASRWQRFEDSINAQQADYNDVTVFEGSALAYEHDNRPLEKLSFDIKPTPSTLYYKHFDIGDYVTAKYRDYEFNPRITAIEIWLSEQGEEIKVTVENE